MKNFRFFLLIFSVASVTLFVYSCTKDINLKVDEQQNQTIETRSIGCPNPIMTLEVVPATPCAYVKFSYNGTDDPSSDCILISYDIKIFKTWDPEDIKNYNSPFSGPGTIRYPNTNSWVGTLGGSYVNLFQEPIYGSFNNPTPIQDANGTFVYTIPSSVTTGPKTWVCVRINMNCNGVDCAATTKCFDAYTPCI